MFLQETAPENAEKDEAHVNGSEQMDVDVTNEESKPECNESNPEKTADKTEEENKAESEDVEIDVVNEDKKEEDEENVNICENGDEQGVQPESATKEDGKEADSEPQVDIAEPAPIAADPLDITSEKQPDEEEMEEEDDAAAGNEESVEQNGTVEEPEDKVQTENGDAALSEESKADEQKEEPEVVDDKVEGKELNGQTEQDEAESNGVEEASIPVAKIVTEDMPEPTVEVNA